jgi:hypothetical protein
MAAGDRKVSQVTVVSLAAPAGFARRRLPRDSTVDDGRIGARAGNYQTV